MGTERGSPVLASAGAALLTAAAPALAAAASIVAQVRRREVGRARAAVLRWGVVLGPVWLLAVARSDALHVQVLVLLLVAVGLEAARRWLHRGSGWWVLFVSVLSLLGLELLAYQRTFSPLTTTVLEVARLEAIVTGTQRLPSADAPGRPWYRTWTLARAPEAFAVSLEARTVGAQDALRWHVRDALVTAVGPRHDVFSPHGPSWRTWRTWTAARSLGGSRFALTGLMLVPAGVEVECGPIALAIDERPWVRACPAAFEGLGEWVAFSLDWRVPESVGERRLRIEAVLEPSSATPFEVRDLDLVWWPPNAASEERVGGIVPAEITFALEQRVAGGAPRVSEPAGVPADGSWHTLGARLTTPLGPADQVVATLRAPGGLGMEIRNVAVESPGGAALANARPSRAQAWFGHPNVAGHALAAWLLVAAAFAPRRRSGWWIVALALIAIALTGSRSAFAVAAVFGPALYSGWLRPAPAGRRSRRPAIALTLAYGAIVVGVAVFAPRVAAVGADGNSVPRTAIWSAAWSAIGERPWSGWGSEDAPAALATRLVERGHGAVTHAHNVWLDLGVRLGIPGLLTMVWVSVAVVALATRSGPEPTTAILAVLALNLLDATLLVTYVWAPVALLAAGRSASDARPPPRAGGYNPRADRHEAPPISS